MERHTAPDVAILSSVVRAVPALSLVQYSVLAVGVQGQWNQVGKSGVQVRPARLAECSIEDMTCLALQTIIIDGEQEDTQNGKDTDRLHWASFVS